MATEQDFTDAAEKVKSLTRRPSNDELLELYALFKQATAGDVSGKKPSRLKMKERAKFDAWGKQKGKTKDAARDAYVALVSRLVGSYS
jgi:diazepam-binding inhibitor (GABA receptor modulating acyl-CoA-binding protein)